MRNTLRLACACLLMTALASAQNPVPPPIQFEQPVYTPMDFTRLRVMEPYQDSTTLMPGAIDYHTPFYYEVETERVEPENERVLTLTTSQGRRQIRLTRVPGHPKIYRSRPIFADLPSATVQP